MIKFLILFSAVVTLFGALLPQLGYALAWGVARLFGHRLPWWPWLWASLGLVVLWWGAYAYGYWWGRFRSEVNRVEFRHAEVPQGFDGYRIVQISDLHLNGWQGHAKELEAVVQRINDLEADLICFTGDLVSMDESELDASLSQALGRLRARDGVVGVLGNHDYSPYLRGITASDRDFLVDRLVGRLRNELGWQVLMNENLTLYRGGDSIAVVGVENQSCGVHSVVRRGDLAKAQYGVEGLFRILLSHDPSHWRAEVLGHTDIPLTLSGHTHAMQMRLLGWSPAGFAYPEHDGRYDEQGQTLYVNIGLGGTLPMRIGATPEVTEITLRAER